MTRHHLRLVHPQETAQAVPQPSAHVLVVDDDLLTCRAVRRLLRRAGHQVSVATSGEAALEVLRTTADRFDVLLADLVMPGMLGTELLRTVAEEFPGIRPMLMSGNPDEVIEWHGGAGETVPLLAKPIDPDRLQETILEVVDAAHEDLDAAYAGTGDAA